METKADWLRSEIEKLDVMRRCGLETKVRGGDDFESTSCEHCGGYDECDCSGFNEALTTIITRYKEELLELENVQ